MSNSTIDSKNPLELANEGASSSKILFFQEGLLKWFEKNRRSFLWRETHNPWYILLAEVLLQKTNARKVENIYAEFINLYPTPAKLLNAGPELQELLKPLGLWAAKSKILRSLAKSIVENFNGLVPDSFDNLISLPGVGSYIASAVLSFAYEKRTPIVDTNVIRILERYFGVCSTKNNNKERDQQIWRFVEVLLPESNCVKRFNLALVDFGALVCTHYHPHCDTCCIAPYCKYYSRERPFEIPPPDAALAPLE
ncbi:HhH-GPD family protein [Syntrophothermus lipocalidus]|uniref:Adenine DNA glycosylase n=1 Tax=Syntrophothermus lipocalidus (strain DSM 12680 / TGB-C1) TaxID=643648 RepID=D7CPS1_SYNLT|nr:HhH-GPD family protein [Syntrophothermus lipocalidus]ADI02699.1 HhH-GPD family protein [Syntrophothermus lipocalidus DSM 12680]